MTRKRHARQMNQPAPIEDFAVLDNLITTSEAGRLYSYSRRTVTAWCESGVVVARRVGGHYVIYKPSIDNFLMRRLTSR